MTIPKSKSELIHQSQENFDKLNKLVDSFTEVEQHTEFPKGTMNRNIRDVIAHLHHWHILFLQWYKVGMKGLNPDKPATGYNWKQTKELNRKIWKEYQHHDLEQIRSYFEASHTDLQKVIEQHTDEELVMKKKYKWTGSSSLATYIRANTSSHYNWAYKLFKKAKSKPRPKATQLMFWFVIYLELNAVVLEGFEI